MDSQRGGWERRKDSRKESLYAFGVGIDGVAPTWLL